MSFILIFCLSLELTGGLFSPAFAESKVSSKENPEAASYNLQELAFPSEVKDQGKFPGAIFYSPTVKNKVLIPVNMWGEISKPGLHFLPIDTTLVKGLTLAGGATSLGKLENIRIIRRENDKQVGYTFDLSEGGDAASNEFSLKQGDVVFVERDQFIQNRAYYTSLIAIGVSILSGILIYINIQRLK